MYFFAIVCPPEPDKKILQFKFWMKEQFGSVVTLRSPAHITLIRPFWLEEAREANLKDVLQFFASDIDKIEIQLHGFDHFGKRVLFVRVEDNPSLEEVKGQLEDYLVAAFGDPIKKDKRPFRPHISIASRDLKPGDFEIAWEYFSHNTFEEKFSTKTVSLLKLTEGKWNLIDIKMW
jgi:2'-5' RNA ligase